MAAARTADRADGDRSAVAQYPGARHARSDRDFRHRSRHRPAHAFALSARHGGLATCARAAVGPLRAPPGDARGACPYRGSNFAAPPPPPRELIYGAPCSFGATCGSSSPRCHPRPYQPDPRRLDDRRVDMAWSWRHARAADRGVLAPPTAGRAIFVLSDCSRPTCWYGRYFNARTRTVRTAGVARFTRRRQGPATDPHSSARVGPT